MAFVFPNYSRSEKSLIKKVRCFDWIALEQFWNDIKAKNTPKWNPGKALEYMLVRAFELEGAEVVYPCNNSALSAKEQFDGFVFAQQLGTGFLIECKDWEEKVAFDELAKLHGRLSYRMSSAFGLFLSRKGFTASATEMMYLMAPHNILLWSFEEIDECFKNHKFIEALEYKYKYAMITANPNIAVIDGFNI